MEPLSPRQPNHPALNYFGGKWRLANWIIRRFPPHRIYVEPFGGGASVLLRKRPSAVEIYNDVNEDVTAFFRTMRDPPARAELIRLLKLTPFSRSEYKICRAPFGGGLERVRRFVVRSKMSFSRNPNPDSPSGFKANDGAEHLTRNDAGAWVNYIDELDAIAERLRGVLIESRDYKWILKRYDTESTLFYCDPPYMADTRPNCRNAYVNEFANVDHHALARALASLEGMAIISGYRCDLYDDLYRDWPRFEKSTVIRGKRRCVESIWLSPNIKLARKLF